MPPTNMLGVDVQDLDVPVFLARARLLYPILGVVWLALAARFKRPAWLLAGVLAANAYAWGMTNYPLQRLYGLGPSHDRIGNLGLCQVVASGNSPLHTAQVGQLHFEPFWGLFVAALSGWDPDRVLALYPFLPLMIACGFALSLYTGLCAGPDPWSPWARALAAGFATLLSSAPFDFTGVYRVPWSMSFLLKPNHALGLVLFPLLLRAFVAIRGWRGRIAVGLLLNLLGWVFVLHMVYVSCGLVVFAVVSLAARRPEAGRDLLDVLAVLLINMLVVSPYLYMLFAGYPFLVPGPRMAIPPWSAHLLETTTRAGWLFVLGLWGLVVIHRKGDRLSRLWTAQVAGAFMLWTAYIVLSAFQQARERDELYYWLLFLMAASAGFGAWDLAGRLFERLRTGDLDPARRAAAVGLLALPFSLPYWWDPSRMDLYFGGSLSPLPDILRLPTDFLRERTEPEAVVAGDRELAGYISALGARRVLLSAGLHGPPRLEERRDIEERLLRRSTVEDIREARSRFGIRYLAVTPAALAAYPGLTLAELLARPQLERVHLTGDPRREFVAIFRLRPDPPGQGEDAR